MAKKYVFVRMPVDVYNIYKGLKVKMETDIKNISGKQIPLTMPKVFKAVASPEFNENFIEIDLKKLTEFAKRGRR